MQRITVCAAIGAFVLAGNAWAGTTGAGNPAFATNTVSRQTHDRRVLADCMTKRMGASRTISYIEAARVCKDQMKSQRDGLAANNQVRPVNVR